MDHIDIYTINNKPYAEFVTKITSIPAGILLAQGAWESNWGRSNICIKANNFFGIRGYGSYSYLGDVEVWNGEKFETSSNGSFRSYKHPLFSWLDRARLNFTDTYIESISFLFDNNIKDYMLTLAKKYAPNSPATYVKNWLSIYNAHFKEIDSIVNNRVISCFKDILEMHKIKCSIVIWKGREEQIIKDAIN